MPNLRRKAQDQPAIIAAADVIWGVPMREGHSDTDDPIAHAKLVQHAFLLGVDERAVCGFKPPKRASGADPTPRPRLALSGTDNPRCPKCASLVAPGYGRVRAGASVLPEEGVDTDGATPAPREPDWSPRDDLSAAHSAEADDGLFDIEVEQDSSEVDEHHDHADDESLGTKHRSSVRRGGLVTVPAGRRSVIALLPERARGLAIAADIDGPPSDLRVQSVTVLDDGTARITLNRRSDVSVDVHWFIVSSRRRSS